MASSMSFKCIHLKFLAEISFNEAYSLWSHWRKHSQLWILKSNTSFRYKSKSKNSSICRRKNLRIRYAAKNIQTYKKFMCKLCNKVFNPSADLFIHFHIHTNKILLLCKLCQNTLHRIVNCTFSCSHRSKIIYSYY